MKDRADPRLDGAFDASVIDAAQPVVGKPTGKDGKVLIVVAFALLAIVLFAILNARRTVAEPSLVAPVAAPLTSASAPLPPLQVGPASVPPPPPTPPPPAAVAITAAQTPAPPSVPVPDPMIRRRAPSVVVDLGLGSTDFAAGPAALAASSEGAGTRSSSSGAVPSASSGNQEIGKLSPVAAAGAPLQNTIAQRAGGSLPPFGSATEQFARRAGQEEPSKARATAIPNLGFLVPQGTVIPGVLETAINSDLPGFTRAIVSRDVRSFDGKTVLIPRGSRVIGQYKSAVALGDTRAFVIWTRIIRPDGVSILIDSPGGDALGRGGLDGEVNRHFFTRFGGSILLSVLNAAVAAIGGVPTTQVTIGSPGAAIGAASTVAGSDPISPTIKVPQGAIIRIFAARDLDFSGVGAAK